MERNRGAEIFLSFSHDLLFHEIYKSFVLFPEETNGRGGGRRVTE